MDTYHARKSWDTSIKHLARHGILKDILTPEQIATIPRSNIARWKQEKENKYALCEINTIVKQEIELIKRINQSSKIKKINEAYFKINDTFHQIIFKIKGLKSLIKKHKDSVVNVIEEVKHDIPIDKALKVFNINRSTYQNYKTILIHTCNASYFNWCTKRFSNQLLKSEVETIKKYMLHQQYKQWSKASVYLKAIRDGNLQCAITTFYKYCQLLGFKNKVQKRKSVHYNPVKTSKTNQIWCADVTIFKTKDLTKHYIHFLMDHYSKYILGYKVCKKPASSAIKELLENACKQYTPEKIRFLTDGGSENANLLVTKFIDNSKIPINHIIAQKDIIFSNSMVEALNKVIKHQFLYAKKINNSKQLSEALEEAVLVYNTIRPQMSLKGNTPGETWNGVPIDFSKYNASLDTHKAYRRQQNKRNSCKIMCS
ncbi:DDE-type integrase/transposase/recombinase [Aquimarina sp. TRL1]|uniref:DDE-type integrase/transposase/recombinase n=1 Tax=Aquimarina sp. (strain TRL1) TaxID=2736252 RepID=UPI00158AF5EA|nr:DDE-type integrase/transposase/recombinase [Aquimarina sp. TRL1]QKX05406.1 DDE-type integrase/transposase/recombinase [Aquimarina sp. TRL1]